MQSCMMKNEWAGELNGGTDAAHLSKLSAAKFFKRSGCGALGRALITTAKARSIFLFLFIYLFLYLFKCPPATLIIQVGIILNPGRPSLCSYGH